MVKRFFVVLIAITTLSSPNRLQATEKIPAAVINLVPQNVSHMVTATLSECLRTELFNTGQYDVINRENMKEILQEQKFQMAGLCDNMGCIVQVGKVLGVKKMFTGSLGKLGKKYVLTLKIVDVQSAKIDNIEKSERICAEEDLSNLLRDTLGRLVPRAEEIIEKKVIVPPVERKEFGKIKVKTDPPTAELFLGTDYKGKGSYDSGWVKTGKYIVTVKLAGYVPDRKEVVVKSGETTFVNVTLAQQRGSIKVESFPLGGKVYVDGKYQGETTEERLLISDLVVGLHKVKIEKENYYTWSDDVKVDYLETTDIEAELEGKPGSLRVISTPEDAEVWIDGKRRGKTGAKIKDVSARKHWIEVVKDGYEKESLSVTIEPGKGESINVHLKKIKVKEVEVPEYKPPKEKKEWPPLGFDSYISYRNLRPTNETFKSILSGISALYVGVDICDIGRVGADFWSENDLEASDITALSGRALELALTLPYALNENFIIYGGGGGRFESISVNDGSAEFGNNGLLLTVGAKLRFFDKNLSRHLGIEANYSRTVGGTYTDYGMFRIGLLCSVVSLNY